MTDQLPPGTESANVMAAHSAVPQVITTRTGDMGLSGSTPLVLLRQAWENLFDYARSQADAGHYQIAVVFAHAACELQTEGALNQLLNVRSDKVLVKLIALAEGKAVSLANSHVYGIYAALTDDDPNKTVWWDQWHKSRQDRHDVAHRGSNITKQQATNAITAAEKHLEHVSKAVAVALGKLASNSP